MALTYILRKFVVWADGFGKLGEGEYAKLPVMENVTEDFRGGGMDTPIKVDLGTTPLIFEFKLSAMDPQVYSLWGLYPGREKQFTVRGSLANQDGTPWSVLASMSGNLHKSESEAMEPAKKLVHTFTVDLVYYKLLIASKLIYEIDIINGIRVVGGVNQTDADGVALGITY